MNYKNNIINLTKEAHNSELFIELYELIVKELKLKGSIFQTKSGKTMIGFKYVEYKEGVWPIVAIAPQKNNISIYISAMENKTYLVEKYGIDFGKSNLGKTCLRIKTMTPEREKALKKILQKVKKTKNYKINAF
ncbi:MAG: hypothetical protein ACK5HR_01225 [Mycoplasmatales bacterium]